MPLRDLSPYSGLRASGSGADGKRETLMTRLVLALLSLSTAAIAQPPQLSSFQAFQKAATVIRHPRCVNCHIPGDQPLNGADGDVHPMLVKRGVDGQGTAALRCSTCHLETNGELPHSPPGIIKGWQL